MSLAITVSMNTLDVARKRCNELLQTYRDRPNQDTREAYEAQVRFVEALLHIWWGQGCKDVSVGAPLHPTYIPKDCYLGVEAGNRSTYEAEPDTEECWVTIHSYTHGDYRDPMRDDDHDD